MVIGNMPLADFLNNRSKKTGNSLQKSLEKLSSGYKINRAADDAASLAISEKMRTILCGLEQGVDNINDGISYVRSVDGASQEINNMIHRLKEIAVQAANGTYDDEIDRASLDCEYQQLLDEIGQITDTADFNGLPLFEKHLECYGAGEGYVEHGQSVTIDGNNDTLRIGYTLDGQTKVQTFKIPHGSYSPAEALADAIDSILCKEDPNLIIGMNPEKQFTLQTEPGRLEFIGGNAASLFYATTIGSAEGHLLGVTSFSNDTVQMEIIEGANDVMSFRLGNEDDTLYTIKLDKGWYNRPQLIDHINEKLAAAGLADEIQAIPETNAEGKGIIGLASEKAITGLAGNFIKMDGIHSPIYDISMYGCNNNTQSVLAGKKLVSTPTQVERGRNEYFVLNLSYYGDDASKETASVRVDLLADGENIKELTPAEIAAKINEKLGDLPFKAEINAEGCLTITSEQYGKNCSVKLDKTDVPSKYMVYDYFDAGTLDAVKPSNSPSSYTAASLTAKKTLGSAFAVPDGENTLSFEIDIRDGVTSSKQTISFTIPPKDDYTASQLQTELNNQLAASYPDLSSKLEFAAGGVLSLSAKGLSGDDIFSIKAVKGSSSAYNRLIGGRYYSVSFSSTQGSEKDYITYSGGSGSGGGSGSSGAGNVTSTAGRTTQGVRYLDETSLVKGQSGTYITYGSNVSINSEDGETSYIGGTESEVDENNFVYTPATLTLKNVMTQFTAPGKSLTPTDFAFTLKDKNGEKNLSITIPAGKTSSEALQIINDQIKPYASAAVNGNNLVIASVEKGDGVALTAKDGSLLRSAVKNSLANNPNAVIDEANNMVYTPSKLTVSNALSQIPYTADDSSNRFVFTSGGKTYDFNIENKTYSSLAEIAQELNSEIAAADGGNAGTTVTVSGRSLVFTGPAKEGGAISISDVSTCLIGKTKVEASPSDPDYNPATGNIEAPATLRAQEFVSHFTQPLVIDSSNNTITMDYTSPSGTESLTIKIPEGTYSSPSQMVNAINDAIAADSNLNGKITASYNSSGNSKGLVFETVKGGNGYNLSNLGGTAKFDQVKSIASPGANGTVDPTANKVYYPASASNSNFGGLFDASTGGMEITSANKTVALTINGTDYSFELTEGNYSGTAGRDDILNQLRTGFAAADVTIEISGNSLNITTNQGGRDKRINLSSANTSPVFSRTNTVADPSSKTRVDSRCSITGQNNVNGIEIKDYFNSMSFEFGGVNGVNATIDVTVEPKTYTAAELAAAIQEKIDAAIGADQLTVTASSAGRITIKGANASTSRYIRNFDGGLFDHVFQDPDFRSIKVHSEVAGTSQGGSLSYIVGRNNMQPSTEDEIKYNVNAIIYTGLNDNVVFDLHYNGEIHTIDFTIPAGSYTPQQIADAVEEGGRREIAKLTDSNGNPFPADFFNASIGLSELGVTENNTGISSSDKLVLWCKLPDDGTNQTINAIIDGVRGNSAYKIFYDATRSPEPSRLIGKPDLSDGIEITTENNIFSFELDSEPNSITIPEGQYTLDELIDAINGEFESQDSIVRVAAVEGHLMFYTTKHGSYQFDYISGNAANDLFYGITGRDDDGEIGIHTGRRSDSYIIFRKTRLDEHLMRINTTGVTTVERALKAIDRLEYANRRLTTERALSGANENRSEHALSRNQTQIENLTAAESRLRDAKIADYAAELAKHQILMQTQQNLAPKVREHYSSALNFLA